MNPMLMSILKFGLLVVSSLAASKVHASRQEPIHVTSNLEQKLGRESSVRHSHGHVFFLRAAASSSAAFLISEMDPSSSIVE